MNDDDLTIRRLAGLEDPLLMDWLDLYEETFPLSERSLVSALLAGLRDGSADLLAAADPEGRLVALAYLEPRSHFRVGYLIYLAVQPDQRSRGVGGRMLAAVCTAAQRRCPDLRAVMLEVEDPDEPQSGTRESALRRIAFYTRYGGRILGGIDYRLRGPLWHEAVPLRVMFLPVGAITPSEALEAVQATLDGVTVLGEPFWAPAPEE